MKLIGALCFLSVLVAHDPFIYEQGDNTQNIKDFVSKFDTEDSLARQAAYLEFEKAFTSDYRTEKLARLWDVVNNTAAEMNVRKTILAYLLGKSNTEMPWNKQIKARVSSAGKSRDAVMRQLTLNLFIKRREPESRTQTISFLKDESNDIRELAIIEISRWADAKPTLEAYVKANQNKAKWNSSVNKAKFFLSKRGPDKNK